VNLGINEVTSEPWNQRNVSSKLTKSVVNRRRSVINQQKVCSEGISDLSFIHVKVSNPDYQP
jgi:hypothetical protein